MGWFGRVGRSAIEVDRALVALTSPVRNALVTVAVLGGAMALDRLAYVIPAAIGMLFAGIADPETPDGPRFRVMVWAALWGALAALVAGLVSDSLVAVLVATVPVLMISGFAGAFGGRSAVVGVLVGVVFAIFAGTPTTMDASVRDAVSYLAGGLLMAVVVAVPGVVHRFRSSRIALARCLRGLAHVRPGRPNTMMATGHAARIRAGRAAVAADRPEPAVADWFTTMADHANDARLALLVLAVDERDDPARRDAVDRFVTAAAGVAGAAARCVVWPFRRPGLAHSRDRLADAAVALDGVVPPEVRGSALRARAALDAVADALLAPWPIGRVGRRSPVGEARPPWRRRVAGELHAAAGHLRWTDPFLRHAVRLTVTFGIAVVVSDRLDLPHPYWLPMTVAWISKPAQSDTTTKVVARVCGTIVGVLVSAAVLEVVDPGQEVLVALIGIAAALALAYLFANYTLAVTGVTIFVFFLFTLAGEEMGSSFASRLIATVLAGVLVFVAAVVWPTRTGTGIAAALAGLTGALAAYAQAVLVGDASPEEVRGLHTTVLEHRTAADADLQAVGFEVGRHRLDAVTAEGVRDALHGTVGHCLVRELDGASDADRAVAAAVRVEFVDLEFRLRAVHESRDVPARDHPPAADHPVHAWLRRAHETLDAAPGPGHRHHHSHDRLR